MAEKQRKMVDLEVFETSGVDLPAHLTPGWCVMKSASEEQIEGIFGTKLAKEAGKMAEVENSGTEEVTIAKSELDALNEQVANLTAELEVAKAAKAEEPELTEEQEFMKNAPEALRKQFEAMNEQIAKAEQAAAVEKAARLDNEAIAKSKTIFKNLGINHEEVAPALRRIEEQNPELAETLRTVLSAADAQLGEAGVFAEVGSNSAGYEATDAETRLDTEASKLVADGVVKTKAQGIAKALELNPALYDEYMAEKEGK